MTLRRRCVPVALAVLAALGLCEAANADPRITMRWTGGLGGGLSAGAGPHTITRGDGDVMWFTEASDPGGVARATNGVNELRAPGAGFTANGFPHRIALGPDGATWFTMSRDPGRLVRMTSTGTVTAEYTGGVTPGFSANGTPAGLAAGAGGELWMVHTTH